MMGYRYKYDNDTGGQIGFVLDGVTYDVADKHAVIPKEVVLPRKLKPEDKVFGLVFVDKEKEVKRKQEKKEVIGD